MLLSEYFYILARYYKPVNFIKQKTYISIPKVILNHLDSKEDFTIVEFFFKLKGLTNCGCIHNYRKKYTFLSGELGLCESSIRKRISLLKEKGLLWTDSNGSLFIGAKSKIVEYLGYKNNYDRKTSDVKFNSLKIKKEVIYGLNTKCDSDGCIINDDLIFNGKKVYDIHNIKYWDTKINYGKQNNSEKEKFKLILYTYKFNNNIEQQKVAYKKKHVKKLIGRKITDNKNHISTYDKKVVKQANKQVDNKLSELLLNDNHSVKLMLNNIDNNKFVTEFIKNNRNTNFTLSRKGLAKQAGFKSPSTGTNIINKLKKLNLINKDEVNEYVFNDNGILLDDLSFNNNINKLGRIYYSSKKKSTILRYSNNLEFNNFELGFSFLQL